MTTFLMNAFWNIENLENLFLLCRFQFTVNREKDIARESFSSKVILCSPWKSYII
jgi:hypothetical protein